MKSMVLVFLVNLVLVTCFSSPSSYTFTNSSISSIRCLPKESSSLLSFINSMTINYSDPFVTDIRTWKKGSDCCGWDGITCHPTSHHVVELDLDISGLVGTLDSNNTLFQLRHLRFLDLSFNDFCHSPISPMFASSFPLLEELILMDSNFSGEIPVEISQLSKLHYISLSSPSSSNGLVSMKRSTLHTIFSNLTHLTKLFLWGVNINSTIPPSLTNLSSLTSLHLSNCNLRGELPANVLNMPQLELIVLGENHDLHANFPLSNWSTSLIEIVFSNVNFSSKLPPSFPFQYQPTRLESLYLTGCNFHGQIPDWVWKMAISKNTSLSELDLSDNKFSGRLSLPNIHSNSPNFNFTTSSLVYFNISHNYLTGRLTSLPWQYLEVLDLSHNMFDGPLLIPPVGVSWFSVSNNYFTGPLPSSLCNLTSLQILDLSNNRFKYEVPQCLGNINYNLTVLNLGSNYISGTLADDAFSNCSNLEYLDLSLNLFKGPVPKLLTRCKQLEMLNLRNNKFLDEFPHWISTFSNIQVLDLSNNGFFGPLPSSNEGYPFPELRVLDLSYNNLTGEIPSGFLDRFKALMNTTRSVGSPEYMSSLYGYYYSIILTFNGVEFKYEKIIKTLASLDLSNNKFEGEIPNNIGKLVSLHGLNLSHNQFIGHIPPSIAKLTLLNCLDLSSNKLTGRIPQELASLSSLGVFRVSNNQLEGPIPHDNHFETFPVDSYEGNLALCGIPLPECGEHGRPRSPSSKNDSREVDEGTMSEWKVVMMGCGFGTFVSFVWGCYMLSIGRPLWLLKLVMILVDLLKRCLFGRRRRRPTRGRD